MGTKDTLSELNQVVQTCRDGDLGYRNAVEHVRNTELESVFAKYSKQHSQFTRDLQAELRRWGGATRRIRDPPAE